MSGGPGFVVRRPLPLLAPLVLLQPVFVLRGLVHVPLLQSLGHVLPQPPVREKTPRSARRVHPTASRWSPQSPGLCPPLLLQGAELLLCDQKLGRVDDFGFSAAVGELQRAVPLALGFADDGAGRVVFDLRRDPAQGRLRLNRHLNKSF